MPGTMNQEKRPHQWTLLTQMGDDGFMKTFVVTGMTCANCVRHVTEAVDRVAGVETVNVDLEAGTATVQGDPDSAAVIAAIVAAGYQAAE